MTAQLHSIDAPAYIADHENEIVAQALGIVEARMRKTGDVFANPQQVKDYLSLRIGGRDHEVFFVVYLSAQNQVIELIEEFRGTLTQTSVYPREIVKHALHLNAANVILSHNHPSGTTQPSRADEVLTQTLKTALALIDVRILDHIIVSGKESLSMAEKGLL